MDKVFIRNFRVFNDKYAFDIAPITVLTGKNNSGKSSFIKSILILSDLLNGSDQTHLNFKGTFSFKHKITNVGLAINNKSKGLKFGLGFIQEEVNFRFELSGERNSSQANLENFTLSKQDFDDELNINKYPDNKAILEMKLDFLEKLFEGQQQNLDIVEEIDIEHEIKKVISELKKLNEEKELMSSSRLAKTVDEETKLKEQLARLKKFQRSSKPSSNIKSPQIRSELNVEANNVRLTDIIRKGILQYLNKEIEAKRKTKRKNKNSPVSEYEFTSNEILRKNERAIKWIDKSLSIKAIHIGANRTQQNRVYHSESNETEISNIVNFLANKPLKPKSLSKEFLCKWLSKEKFDIADDISIKGIEGTAASIYLQNGDQETNLADMGYGTGQIITVLLNICSVLHDYEDNPRKYFGTKNTILMLIEEPETNLHPRLQSLLAEMFIDAIFICKRYFNLKFIVETHSEYFIRKLQLLTAKNKISTEDSVIYYMDFQTAKDEKYKQIRIESDGKLSDSFEEGFYDEADKVSTDLYKEQLKIKKSKS